MPEVDPIKFKAFIPPAKSAFQADGDEIRITLAIPKSDRMEGLRMFGMFDKVFEVTVKEY